MDLSTALLTLPVSREMWIVLLYVGAVIVGARGVESMARMHFERARRYAERDFEYDPIDDRYRCPEGELLPLRRLDFEKRLAIYGAPANRCRDCRLKTSCTPYEDGRQIARSLASWTETDVGSFHRRLSLLMLGAAVVLSAAELWQSAGQRGTGLLVLALFASLASLTSDWSRGTSFRGVGGSDSFGPGPGKSPIQ